MDHRLNRIRLMSRAAPTDSVYTTYMFTTLVGSSFPTQPWYGDLTTSLQFSSVTLASVGLRTVLALAIVLIGYGIAKLIQSAVVKGLETLRLSKMMERSPVGEYTKQPELATQIESIISSIIYWLLMLVVFNTAASAAGFTALEKLFSRILSYVPNLLVAVIILVLGTLLAGFFETVVKNSVRSFDPRAGRLMGKVTSYVIMALAVMIAISELGIAREYILVLFIGFVATLTIGVGLALGLGGQHLVKELLQGWYERFQPTSKGK